MKRQILLNFKNIILIISLIIISSSVIAEDSQSTDTKTKIANLEREIEILKNWLVEFDQPNTGYSKMLLLMNNMITNEVLYNCTDNYPNTEKFKKEARILYSDLDLKKFTVLYNELIRKDNEFINDRRKVEKLLMLVSPEYEKIKAYSYELKKIAREKIIDKKKDDDKRTIGMKQRLKKYEEELKQLKS